MSNQIRSTITSKKGQLQRQLTAVPKYAPAPQVDPTWTEEEQVIHLTSEEEEVDSHVKRLQTTVDTIETAQAEWTKVLSNRTADERAIEEKAYVDFMATDANPTNSLDLATEVIEKLEAYAIKVRRLLSSARLKVDQKAEKVRDQVRLTQLPVPPSSTTGATPVLSSVKLPKIQLAKFAGARDEWAPFKRLYKSTIEDNEPSNVIRMTHLLSLLEGQPKRLISSLEISSANYPKAMELLDKEYGDERLQLKELLMKLRTLPECKSFAEVKEFRLQLETTCMQLEALKHTFDVTASTMVCVELLSKLPLNIIKKLQEAENKDPTTWDLKAFRHELSAIVKADENAHLAKDLLASKKPTEKPSTPREKHPKEKAVVYSTQVKETKTANRGDRKGDSPKKREPTCNYCSGSDRKGHWGSECEKYKSLQSRKERASELKLCSKCHYQPHHDRDCRLWCFYCRNKEHVTSMCTERKKGTLKKNSDGKQRGSERKAENKPDDKVVTSSVGAQLKRDGKTSVSMCVRAEVYNPLSQAKEPALVVFDTLSHLSFIKKELRDKLGLQTEAKTTLPLLPFKAQRPIAHECEHVKLGMKLRNGRQIALNFFTTDQILTDSAAVLLTDEDLKKAATYGEWVSGTKENPDLLIGIDQEALFDIKNVYGSELLASGFSLKDTLLGPVLSGRGQFKLNRESHAVHAALIDQAVCEEPTPDELLRDYFKLERMGVEPEPDIDPDQQTHQFFKDTTKRNDDGRFQASLPWNAEVESLPSNYRLAKRRLVSNFAKGKHSPKALAEYQAIVDGKIEGDVIEVVENPEAASEGPIHYLAHQLVTKEGPNGELKVRMILDGAAKMRGQPSLNDCLERGPVMLNDLMGVLMRLRTTPIAILSDVAKAFLQVELNPRDRDATRFLWPKDLNDPEGEVIVYRFKRLPFGLKSSPFILAASIDELLLLENSPLAEEIRSNIYVDNVLLRANDIAEARVKCAAAKEIFKKAQMPLREFLSNSKEALALLHPGEILNSKISKVLGTRWNVDNDELIFRMPPLATDLSWTLRRVASAISSLYDPLGLLAPSLVPARRVLQEVWQHYSQAKSLSDQNELTQATKLRWNAILPKELQAKWILAISSWAHGVIHIDRRVVKLGPRGNKYELHAYGDASDYAFGACVYLVTRNGDQADSQLIMSKVRVKPSQGRWTIPRLELMGALFAARALKYAQRQLDLTIDDYYLWIDAMCVVDWIKSPQQQERFVENRRKQIRANRDFALGHVPGVLNPADILSRGMKVDELAESSMWFHGPEYLLREKAQWPCQPVLIAELPEIEEKEAVIFDTAANTIPLVSPLIDPSNYSNWKTLRLVVGYVFKFLKKRLADKLENPASSFIKAISKLPTDVVLTSEERRFAGYYLLRRDQELHPPDAKVVKNLRIYIDADDGLMRSRGQLEESELEEGAKYPIFLDRASSLTKLLVLNAHQELHHLGPKSTLAKLRKTYWFACGRRTVGTAIRRLCRGNCWKFQAEHFAPPPAPNLPAERVIMSRVFENTGLDYAGPFTIKESDRSTRKVYVVLFTCMVTRNLHLEVVLDYGAESFILAFRRFVSKRGRPAKLYSDHGSQLNLSAKIVAEAFRSRGFQAFLAEKNILWRQLTEKAPWTGGFYERLIALTKSSMRRTIGRSILRLDKFTTLISEMEAFLNGRPMTYQSDQLIQGSLRPLRPIDFLFPAGESVEPAHVEEGDDFAPTSRDQLLDKLAKDHVKLEKFKQIFYEEYLPELRDRKSKSATGVEREPVLGEVVLVEDDDPHRLSWQLGRIIELLRSRDGQVRTVKLWTGRSLIRRPVSLLYPLEVDPKPTNEDGPDRIEIKRKGKVLRIGSETPQPEGRTHKMKLRARKSPLDSDSNTPPISVLSMALAEEELVLDYNESYDDAPTNGEHQRDSADAAISNRSLKGEENRSGQLDQSKHHHHSGRHHNQGDRSESRRHSAHHSHPRHRQGRRQSRSPCGRQHSSPLPTHRHPSSATRQCTRSQQQPYKAPASTSKQRHAGASQQRWQSRYRSRSPGGVNSKRNQSARRKAEEKAKVEQMRSLLGAIHQKGGVPVINSNRVGANTKRTIINTLGLAKADEKRLAAIEADRRKLQREMESEQPFISLAYSDSGLEPVAKEERRDGPRPIDLSMEGYLYHQRVAYQRTSSPIQLVAIYWALRQETSQKTVDFTNEILLAERDMVPMVWAKWRVKFNDNKIQRADADNALTKWLEHCPKAKASLDQAPTKPFQWITPNSPEDAELAGAWIGALHRRLSESAGRKLNYAQVTMIGDAWAAQLGLSLAGVYALSGSHQRIIDSLNDHFFAHHPCDQQQVVLFTGKECMTEALTDEQWDQHFEELKELWRNIPPYVTISHVQPPRIPGREIEWQRYDKLFTRLIKATRAKVVLVPQLGEGVSPKFLEEAMDQNGTLREWGAWIVAEQLSHYLKIPLAFKPKALKRTLKGLYNVTLEHVDDETHGENRPPIDERLKGLRRGSKTAKASKLGVASSSLLLVCLFSLFLPARASGLMLCKRSTNSLLYNVSTSADACRYSIHDFNEKTLMLKIFERNDKEYIETGWNCVRRATTVKYHSDWHGDNFATPPEITYHEVTPGECRRWNQSNQAIIHGKKQSLGNEAGERRTNNIALLDYPSWYQFWVGERKAETENCMIIPSVISATSRRDHVVSPAGDSRGCRYSSGECALEDGSALIWAPVKRQLCQYKSSISWNGSYYLEAEDRWIWTAESQQFSLRFSRDSPRIHDCHDTYVLSDQGFGILESDYEKITSTRQKRNDLNAARLTASQVHSFKNLRAAVKSIHRMLCKQLGSNWMSDPESVTLSMREMLNNTYLQAESPLKDVVEVWPCVPAPVANLTFLRSESCFKHPRVNATIGGETATFHLHSKLMILMPASDEGSCEVHQFKLVQWHSRLLQLDQLTGKIVDRTNEVAGMPTTLSLDDPLANLGPLTFVELLGANHSEPSEKWEQFLRAIRNKEAAKNRNDWHVNADDNEPSHHYEVPFTWMWFFKKLLPSDLVVKISVLLWLAFIAYKLFKIYAWPFIAVRLLKKAITVVDDEHKRLRATIGQMEEAMKQMESQLQMLQNNAIHNNDAVNTEEDHGRGSNEPRLRRGTTTRKTICRRDYLSDRGFMSPGNDVLKPGVSGTNGS